METAWTGTEVRRQADRQTDRRTERATQARRKTCTPVVPKLMTLFCHAKYVALL